MSLLILDNYDSFTYNLYDYFLQLGVDVNVVRNDALSLDEFIALAPSALVLSPGPGRPKNAGLMMSLIKYFHNKIPILGICLGHQAIGEFFGANLVKAKVPVHGKTSYIEHNGHFLYSGLPGKFKVMRYHSLIIKNLEDTGLSPIAVTEEGELMAMCHDLYPLSGIQYHPESVLTEYGIEVLENWLKTIQNKDCLTVRGSKLYSEST